MITRTPKNASSASSGTTTYGVRSRSSSRLETTKPIAPPACWRGSGSPSCGLRVCRWRCARCRARRTAARSSRSTWRPAGPLASGSRRLRQPTKQSSSGTSQPSMPTEPATTVRVKSTEPPGSCHHTAAAATTARPTRNSPAPSRRCSGSSSRAVCPTGVRRTEGVREAQPDRRQHPADGAKNARPDQVRCARPGAPDGEPSCGWRRLRFVVAFWAGLRSAWLPDDRERVLEPPWPDFRAEVLLLRDPGGEDVRVAMVWNLPRRPHLSLASHAAQQCCRHAGPSTGSSARSQS